MDQVTWSFRCLLLPVSVFSVVMKLVAVTSAAPAAHLVPRLPGQPNDSTFKQYAGYVTIDETAGRKLFYYFVEAENSSSTRPLVLWLNGGPGCSSLIGGFTELGPFYPNASANGLEANNGSWNKVANVIFLESPVGVGFSYANDTSTYFSDDASTAKNALAFLLGWLAEYPEYNSTDFYITGESYAGHYVPQLAAAIVTNNKVPGETQIQLKGIMYSGVAVPDPCISNDLSTYLNSPDVQTALHAKPMIWQQCYPGYDETSMTIPISPILADLVGSNLRVWVYTGDLDSVVSVIGTRKILNTLARSLNWTTESEYQPWFQGSQVGGWSISWGTPNMTVVYSTVRGASHMVPATQPARSLVLFSSFLVGATPPLLPS